MIASETQLAAEVAGAILASSSLRWAREVRHVLAPCPRESPSLLPLYLRPGHLLPQHNRDVVMLRLVFWVLHGAPVPHQLHVCFLHFFTQFWT